MAGFKEAIMVKQRLDELIQKLPDEETVTYKAGHSDESVGSEIGASTEYVAQIRREYFGKLKPTRGGSSTPRRLDQLEYQNAMLEKNITDLRDRFNRLVDNLSMNRVVDVRHLKATQLDLSPATPESVQVERQDDKSSK